MNEYIAIILIVLVLVALYDPDDFGGPDNIHSY
jgi:hypothetical protein